MLAVALAVSACGGGRGDGERRVLGVAETTPGTLLVNVDACRGPENLPFEVEETADRVTVTVREVDIDPDGSDGCSSGLVVLLDQPLGDRDFFDGSTDEAVPLSP